MASAPGLLALDDEIPAVHPSAWVAPGAVVVGNVVVGADVGIYYGAVIRAEVASIRIGERTNIQDNCVLHAGLAHSVTIGTGVTVGHAAIVHGCTIGDDVLVGMGAVLLNDCVIGDETVVGAGTLVLEGTQVPPGSLVVGRPGRVVRPLTEQERSAIREGTMHYLELLPRHRGARVTSREDGDSGEDQHPRA